MTVESPLLQELLEDVRQESRQEGRGEGRQDSVLDLLAERFGVIPDRIAERVRGIRDDGRLRELLMLASTCPDMESFESALR